MMVCNDIFIANDCLGAFKERFLMITFQFVNILKKERQCISFGYNVGIYMKQWTQDMQVLQL